MLLHSVHNFVIGVFWNNKWVTFSMVILFLLPIMILKRKRICQIILKIFNCKNARKMKITLTSLFILIYIYIFLCCLLAF
jgi:hypothetical protein